ncbi:MAG: sugar phosphate nucleotidyltransferase [Gemmatimonadota bacterium]|nr:sugar phosphate nucleotidyltransferase [Gemmatimonadota bacterium]
MKVIIPLAGKGTRLMPLTRHVPKPLIRVAGRPVMDYVMDMLDGLDVEELVLITGHLKEQVEQHVRTRYRVPARFIEQRVQDGTAGAVALAEPHVAGPVLIIFVDTLFDADLALVKRDDADGIIWAKEVEDYQRFGVVVTDADGFMTRIVEKPSEPISRLANIGLYFMRDWQTMFAGIHRTLDGPKQKGEWFLTDAFQYMIDQGRTIRVAEVTGWYDCGKVETVLETNLHLLETGRARPPRAADGVRIVEPVRVEDGVTLERCTIGPNVTVETGAVIRDSTVRHTIVGARARVTGATVDATLVGDDAVIAGGMVTGMVVARDETAPAR